MSRLGLAPGDAMIYRIVGRDERPGEAGLASSETFFIEVAGPGQVALAGFELPPDRERYALSQQMIVLKLERLRAREQAIDRATLEQEVGNIAAEQRAVRANFVFLMGGEVEDEEAEAEHSHEIQEGRLENTARREIVDAIQHMGRSKRVSLRSARRRRCRRHERRSRRFSGLSAGTATSFEHCPSVAASILQDA